MTEVLRLAVFLSGSGSTLQNLIDRIDKGELSARIEVVVSSKPGVYGLERAEAAGIPTEVVPSKDFARDWDAFSRAIDEKLADYDIDLVVLAGFMCMYRIPPDREGRVMNVHPSLIPAFCGKAMFGHLVHEAVLEHGVKVTGCTVHFANNEYDAGPIILQKVVPVLDDDTPETLAERVQAAEREAYPEAINLFAQGRLKIEGRRVRTLNPKTSTDPDKQK